MFTRIYENIRKGSSTINTDLLSHADSTEWAGLGVICRLVLQNIKFMVDLWSLR